VMAFRRPIDAGVPSLLVGHAFSPLKTTSHRDPRRSLYWRSKSGSHFRRGLPTGHRSRPIRQGTRPPPGGLATGGSWSLPANRLGSGSLRFRPSPGRARFVALRSTPRALPHTPHEPPVKGTGGRNATGLARPSRR
jgi:hypothetical protein